MDFAGRLLDGSVIPSGQKELGTPLVERMSRGVRVTAAGRVAAQEARTALAAAERAVELGRRVGAGTAGRLRIACAETMTAWLLVPVLRTWRARRPDVWLDLMEFTSADRMVEHLAAGGTDLVVGPEPTATTAHVEVLGREEMVVVASTDHPFASQPSVSVEELIDQPFVHFDPENGMASWVDHFVASQQVAPLTPVVRTRNPRTAAHLAGAGMGVTLVPVSALTGSAAAAVRRLEPRVHRDIVAITMTPSDALVRQFVADLRRKGVPDVDTAAVLHDAAAREDPAGR